MLNRRVPNIVFKCDLLGLDKNFLLVFAPSEVKFSCKFLQ